MKKIKGCNEKDRIICASSEGKQDFYYQLYGTKERIWLFQIPSSPSVIDYYRSHGCNLSDQDFSITVAQMYKFKKFNNVKLNNVFKRLPNVINYVLTYELKGDKELSEEVIYGYHRTSYKLDERIA